MSAAPDFFGIPKTWSGTTPATLDTSLTAPSNVTTIFTASGSNSPNAMVAQISIIQIATSANAGVLNIFLYDGSTYHLRDQMAYAAVTLTTTTASTPVDKYYSNLLVPNGWSVRVSVTTSGGQSAFKVNVHGGMDNT